MRWFLMSSSVIRGGNLVVTEEGIRAGVRELLLPLWSTYYFFTLYANTAGDGGYERDAGAPTRTNVLDRYLLAKTRAADRARSRATSRCSTARSRRRSCATSPTCSPTGTCAAAATGSGPGDDRDAFDTLYTVLETVTPGGRAAHPAGQRGDLARPHRRAQRAPRRTGRTRTQFPEDDELVAAMDACARSPRPASPCARRAICACACRSRKLTVVARRRAAARGVRRHPARRAQRQGGRRRRAAGVEPRRLRHHPAADRQRARPRPAARQGRAARHPGGEGRRLDRRWTTATSSSSAASRSSTASTSSSSRRPTRTSAIAFLPAAASSCSTPRLTPELEAEGLARDVVRAVQQARKDAGLEVSDRIALTLDAATPARGRRAIETAPRADRGRDPCHDSLDAREAEVRGTRCRSASDSARSRSRVERA